MRKLVFLTMVLAMITACTQPSGGGTMNGGLIGSHIGKSLDNGDRAIAEQYTQITLESAEPGQSVPWQGKNASGTVMPSFYFENGQGQFCREYDEKISMGGRTEQAYARACRQADGSWQVVSQ